MAKATIKASKRYRRMEPETKISICNYVRKLIDANEYKNLDEISKVFYTSNETVRKILLANSIKIPTTKRKDIEEIVAEAEETEKATITPIHNIDTTEEEVKEEAVDDKVVEEKNEVEEVEEVQEEKEEKIIPEFTEITVSKVVKAITCSERHSQPYGITCIFGSQVDSDVMFDFGKLEQKALDYIDNNVKFVNGVAIDSVELIVTGLTMLTTAVITACAKRNVGLTLLHFDRDTKTYKKQVITSFDNSKASPILSTLRENKDLGKVYAYKDTDIFSIKENDKFYIVKFAEYTLNNAMQPVYIDHYITNCYEDSYELFSKILKKAKNETKQCKITVSYMSCTQTANKFYTDKVSDPFVSHTYTIL